MHTYKCFRKTIGVHNSYVHRSFYKAFYSYRLYKKKVLFQGLCFQMVGTVGLEPTRD